MTMRLDRRAFLTASVSAAAIGGTLGWPRPAKAAEFSFKAANNAPESHPLTIRMREAAANVLKDSNGAIDIQIFPNNQLGSDTDMLSQLRSGALEFFTLSPLILSTLVPNAAISGVGFAWSGYDKLWPAMDGELGAYVRGQIQKAGLFAHERIWENGFRQVTSSTKPILTPDDFKGFKIRVPVSPMWTSMFKAFDAAPMSINFSEVYSALQTKIAEGQENPLALINTAKLYEVQKYLSKTNHMWDGFWLLSNGKIWNGLPKDVQGLVTRHFNAAAVAQREDVLKLNNSLEQELAGKGLQFSSVDTAAFRAKLQSAGFYKEWRGKFGEDAWKLLEAQTGPIS
jgi:tripartite ATP-independent transporter DctP family solute receptor